MITIKQKLHALCVAHGLFDSQAEAILQMTFDDGDNELKSRWNDLASDYPDIIFDVLWITVCQNAIKWIDKNCPNHWARSVFII